MHMMLACIYHHELMFDSISFLSFRWVTSCNASECESAKLFRQLLLLHVFMCVPLAFPVGRRCFNRSQLLSWPGLGVRALQAGGRLLPVAPPGPCLLGLADPRRPSLWQRCCKAKAMRGCIFGWIGALPMPWFVFR